ncbi:MAG: PaaI family thioesterase [Sphingomonadales bacterium]|nr:PaaI family thioesterase [Sphingomonadales bacterium]
MTGPDIDPRFAFGPDPDHPGWFRWEIREGERFNHFLGPMRIQPTGKTSARVRIVPQRQHSNLADNVHGGISLAFADIALFAAARTLGIAMGPRTVTVDLSMQFVGAGRLGEPLDAEVEIVRDSRHLVFLRGRLVQAPAEDASGSPHIVASFSGMLKKGG